MWNHESPQAINEWLTSHGSPGESHGETSQVNKNHIFVLAYAGGEVVYAGDNEGKKEREKKEIKLNRER